MMSRAKEPIQALYIISLLETALRDDISVFADSIRLGIKDGTPAVDIIQMIMDQIIDNEPGMARMIGQDLVDRIFKFSIQWS